MCPFVARRAFRWVWTLKNCVANQFISISFRGIIWLLNKSQHDTFLPNISHTNWMRKDHSLFSLCERQRPVKGVLHVRAYEVGIQYMHMKGNRFVNFVVNSIVWNASRMHLNGCVLLSQHNKFEYKSFNKFKLTLELSSNSIVIPCKPVTFFAPFFSLVIYRMFHWYGCS